MSNPNDAQKGELPIDTIPHIQTSQLGGVTQSDSELQQVTNRHITNNARISLFTDLVFQSAFLPPPSKVLSAVLVSTAGAGKSLNLSKFRSEKNVYYTNLVSPKFLIEFLKKVERKEKSLIVIPDFLTATEGSKNNRENILKILRAMTEEGIDDCSHYGYPEVHFNSPVRAGLITATTMDSMNEFKRKWKNDGFLSRVVPFSYTLSEFARLGIEKHIKLVEGLTAKEVLPMIKNGSINLNPGQIKLTEIHAYQLDNIAYKLANVTGNLTAPFRQEKQIYTLTKAHSALRHSNIVEDIDVEAVLDLSTHFNLEFCKL